MIWCIVHSTVCWGYSTLQLGWGGIVEEGGVEGKRVCARPLLVSGRWQGNDHLTFSTKVLQPRISDVSLWVLFWIHAKTGRQCWKRGNWWTPTPLLLCCKKSIFKRPYNMLHGIIIATYGEVHFLLLFIKQFLNSLHQKVQFKLFSDKCTIKLQSNKV